jgi:hypothetical protein
MKLLVLGENFHLIFVILFGKSSVRAWRYLHGQSYHLIATKLEMLRLIPIIPLWAGGVDWGHRTEYLVIRTKMYHVP